MPMMIDGCVAQHRGDRKEQQDRVAIFPSAGSGAVVLAVVADGMGGHAGGALAAQQVIYTCGNNVAQFAAGSESSSGLLESSLAEAHLLIKASRFINEKDPRSTAVLLMLQPGQANWAHCGDSRLYRFRGDQPLFRTVDHSYVEQLVAAGKITPDQARVHPRRNVLITALGGDDAPKIDFGEAQDIEPGDSFLLCSDGLWDYFGDAELARVVAGHGAREAAELLISGARSRARGEGDNVSLIVIKLVAESSAAVPAT